VGASLVWLLRIVLQGDGLAKLRGRAKGYAGKIGTTIASQIAAATTNRNELILMPCSSRPLRVHGPGQTGPQEKNELFIR